MPRSASVSRRAGPLSSFLSQHRKQVKAIQTHTRFDGDRVGTLSIAQDDVAELQRLLLLYVEGKSDSDLGNLQGLNAISEKVVYGHPFRFFVDLDFKLSQLDHMGKSEVITVMQRYISACENTVTTAFYQEFRAVVTRRLDYKLHIHFPDLVVEKKTALALTQQIKEEMRNLPLYSDEVLDQSVYSTGLRMLYCQKGALLGGRGKKKEKGDLAALLAKDLAAHEARFGEGSYQHVYEVIDCETFEKVAPRTMAHILDTSILPSAGQTEVTALPASTTAGLMSGGKRLVKAKGKENAVSSSSSAVGLESEVPASIQTYFETAFSVVLNGKMKVFPDSTSLALSTSNQQECPFKQRKHKGNNVYIYVDAQGAGKRCHDSDCKGKSHGNIPFASFPSGVVSALSELVSTMAVYPIEDKMKALSKEMQRLRKDYPRNDFHIDLTQTSVEKTGAMIKINDLYCPKCKKEHDDPLTFLECNPAGDVFLRCIKNLKPHLLTSIPPSVTNVLFQGVIQININHTVNNYEGGGKLSRGPRDFNSYETFPTVFEDMEINRLLFKSLAGDTYSVAKFMSHIIGNNFIYVSKQWYFYCGKGWDKCDRPNQFVVETVVPVYEQLLDHFTQDAQLKWIQSLISDLSNINKRKWFIEELEGIVVTQKKFKDIRFDAIPHLIAFQNGVYDSSCCQFVPSSYDQYITKIMTYDLPETSDKQLRSDIINFFTQILPCEETRQFLILYLALSLEGRNRHQIMAIFTGNGANGKGIISALMKIVFGETHSDTDTAFLTSECPSSDKPNVSMVSLQPCRSVFSSEPQSEKKINGGWLKYLSGGDVVRARLCGGNDYFEYVPKFLVTLLCNQIPLIDTGREANRSIWRRLKIISFPVTFVDYEPREPHERRIDTGLTDRLPTWGPELMLLLIETFEKYAANGRKLSIPSMVEKQVDEQRKENNPVLRFLTENVRKDSKAVSQHILHVKDHYINWASNEGIKGAHITTAGMKKALVTAGFQVPDEPEKADCCGSKSPVVYDLATM